MPKGRPSLLNGPVTEFWHEQSAIDGVLKKLRYYKDLIGRGGRIRTCDPLLPKQIVIGDNTGHPPASGVLIHPVIIGEIACCLPLSETLPDTTRHAMSVTPALPQKQGPPSAF